MRVLHINSYYFSSLFYKKLYDLQEKKGTEIDVYVPVSSDKNINNFDYGKYTLISKNHNKYDRFAFYIKHFKILKDLRKKYLFENYDVIHAHSLFSNGYLAYMLNKEFNIPYVVAVRNTDVNVFFGKVFFLRKLGIEILKKAKAIIFISDVYKEKTLKKYIPNKYHDVFLKKTFVIPNGIDNYWIENRVMVPKKIDSNKINIVYAGRIDKNKNIVPVAKACELLKQDGYNVNFTIIGKVCDKSEFNQLNKFDFVNYISVQPKEKIIEIYKEQHIFAMASKKETFGLVYAEAITQGLPIIYSKEQGFDGQFKEGTVGYHVDSGCVNDIYLKFKKIIKNYNTLSENCLSFYNKYNWEDIVKIYGHVYEHNNENS